MAKRKKKGVTRLSSLDAVEVSLVPKGANLKKFVKIEKSLKGENMNELLKLLQQVEFENEGEVKELIEKALPEGDDNQKGLMKAAMKLMKTMGDSMKDKPKDLEKVMGALQKIVGVKKEDTTEDTGSASAKGDEEGKTNVSKENTEDGDKGGEMDKVAIQKMIDDAVDTKTAQFKETIQKQADEITSLQADKELASFEQVVTDMNLIGDKKQIAKSLRDIKQKCGDEAYEAQVQILKSQAEVIEKGGLFAEIGSSQAGQAGDAEKAAIAKEMEADPNLTEAQAADRAYQKNPELYNSFLDNNPKQGGR